MADLAPPRPSGPAGSAAANAAIAANVPGATIELATEPAEIAVAFSRVLRGAGLRVPTSSTHTFASALCAVGLDDRAGTYWSGMSTLVRRPEDIAIYDKAFAVFFEHRRSTGDDLHEQDPLSITIAIDTDEQDGADDGPDVADGDDEETVELRFSTTEILRNKDFAEYSPDELVLAQEMMSSLKLIGSPRRSLRLGPARRATPRPDIRRTVRASLKAGGEPIERHFRAPTERLRRLVLVLDVSGSMEPYARALLRFVHAAVAGRQKVEAFALGTRLTRITLHCTKLANGCSTGVAVPSWVSACASSTMNGACAALPATRSSSSCQTGGIVATLTSFPHRWNVSSASRIASSG
jgi:uncharacterized protein with von Willebrand factor type A (vWA) domain